GRTALVPPRSHLGQGDTGSGCRGAGRRPLSQPRRGPRAVAHASPRPDSAEDACHAEEREVMTGDDTSADAVEPLDGEAEELRRGAEASAEDVSSDEAKQRFGEAVAVAARRSGIARAASSGSI